MLIGRHFDDARLLAIARTYERTYGWVPEPPALSRAVSSSSTS
jgi:Asp-tRNA(Asn)/Glu-tRNA(Gln) amidotransferase A subunit family amidase